MTDDAPLTLSSTAYTKVLLHSTKSPTAKVLGLLLSHSDSTGEQVDDATPLAHAWTNLAPAVEAGAALVEAYAASSSLNVVGV